MYGALGFFDFYPFRTDYLKKALLGQDNIQGIVHNVTQVEHEIDNTTSKGYTIIPDHDFPIKNMSPILETHEIVNT